MAAKEIMLAMDSEALSLGSKRYLILGNDVFTVLQPTQIEGDAILCTDVLTNVTQYPNGNYYP